MVTSLSAALPGTLRGEYISRPVCSDTMAMRGMVDLATAPGNQDKFFRDTYWLASDLKSGDAAQYTFIEPRFNILNNYRNGNSMHPLGSVAAGDQFVYQIYSAIRKLAVWESSLLVVSWDEHGGFYDHVTPPAAPPPGESAVEQEKNHRREAAPGDCKFDALGPRVPALLISPYMPKGKLGSALFRRKPIRSFVHRCLAKGDISGVGSAVNGSRSQRADLDVGPTAEDPNRHFHADSGPED